MFNMLFQKVIGIWIMHPLHAYECNFALNMRYSFWSHSWIELLYYYTWNWGHSLFSNHSFPHDFELKYGQHKSNISIHIERSPILPVEVSTYLEGRINLDHCHLTWWDPRSQFCCLKWKGNFKEKLFIQIFFILLKTLLKYVGFEHETQIFQLLSVQYVNINFHWIPMHSHIYTWKHILIYTYIYKNLLIASQSKRFPNECKPRTSNFLCDHYQLSVKGDLSLSQDHSILVELTKSVKGYIFLPLNSTINFNSLNPKQPQMQACIKYRDKCKYNQFTFSPWLPFIWPCPWRCWMECYKWTA